MRRRRGSGYGGVASDGFCFFTLTRIKACGHLHELMPPAALCRKDQAALCLAVVLAAAHSSQPVWTHPCAAGPASQPCSSSPAGALVTSSKLHDELAPKELAHAARAWWLKCVCVCVCAFMLACAFIHACMCCVLRRQCVDAAREVVRDMQAQMLEVQQRVRLGLLNTAVTEQLHVLQSEVTLLQGRMQANSMLLRALTRKDEGELATLLGEAGPRACACTYLMCRPRRAVPCANMRAV